MLVRKKKMCNTTSCPLYFVRSNAKPHWWKSLVLDTCMTQRVTLLRNQGIETTGCCCGHSRGLPEILSTNIRTV